ncbi:MAG: hypothetical protein V2I33_21855 [Kangiellaceae bacterium]|jgi:hypothetical protein|nr:hypothetical protein [Kangiellaceae bacterium]
MFVETLPLRYDKEEAHLCHEFLADLFLECPDIMGPHRRRCVAVFANILETKYINEETPDKVYDLMSAWSEDGTITPELIGSLDETSQAKLNALMDS